VHVVDEFGSQPAKSLRRSSSSKLYGIDEILEIPGSTRHRRSNRDDCNFSPSSDIRIDPQLNQNTCMNDFLPHEFRPAPPRSSVGVCGLARRGLHPIKKCESSTFSPRQREKSRTRYLPCFPLLRCLALEPPSLPFCLQDSVSGWWSRIKLALHGI
jgi:hypothetical protein